MKLPEGWPEAKLPTGWPEPKFDRRLIEAAQNPVYRETALGFEARLRKIFEGNDVGAVITLLYILCPDLRTISCLLARYYGLRRLKNSTTTFATKNWSAPVYWLEDIPPKKGALQPAVPDAVKNKGISIDGSGDNSKEKIPRVVVTSAKSKGKTPMIYGTSEETEGKMFSDDFTSGKASTGNTNTPGSSSLIANTSHAEELPEVLGLVEVGDSLKLDLGANQNETTLYTEEVSDVPGLVELRDSLKLGLRLNQTEAPSREEINVDDYERFESEGDFLKIENEDNMMSRRRNMDYKWENEGDMLLYLKTHRWLQLDATCALYRHERMIYEQTTYRLAESNYHKITLLVEFLTNGIDQGPRVRTLNELEEIYRGSTALCSWLVVTYAKQLYRIFCTKSDLYFC